jgi:site-specific DNA-methyltransferase (adenine-specific)
VKELLGSLELNRIYQMDCLEGMKLIPDKSIDMILCDLPYGTTQCKWDEIIPFEKLWKQYERIIKDNGAIVLTASQPFTSTLIASNLKLFKYSWIWDKVKATGHLNAKKQPLRKFEDICVFYKKQCTYNPQMIEREKPRVDKYSNEKVYEGNGNQVYGTFKRLSNTYTHYYPTNIITFSNADQTKSLHPTQKPVALFEYLIRTYTNENEIILDNCIGSGTTAVAALKNNRKFIGFETEPKYIAIANQRIESTYNELDDEKILDDESL